MKLVYCPPGKFVMGTPKTELSADGKRSPAESQVNVKLTKGYYLGMTEVTQAQWKSVMNSEPWKDKKNVKEGADYPATYVSWDEAIEFCAKLSASEGKKYRLPTEAEWEYACRAGTLTQYSFGEDSSRLGDYAWFSKNTLDIGESYPHKVGQKKPNPWGLHDLHGNVWEWCQDLHVKQLPGGIDPLVSVGSAIRVNRGGAWGFGAAYCRSGSRDWINPLHRNDLVGFRVLLEAE